MSQDYVSVEVDKIVKNEELEFPKNLAMASAWILGNLKGINLKVLDVSKTSSLSDYFIIASATNHIQARSMAAEITHQLTRTGAKVFSREGLQESDWILLDLGDVLIHIFLESSRDAYGLEQLWNEADSVKIPDSYYFSSDEAETQGQGDSTGGRDFF